MDISRLCVIRCFPVWTFLDCVSYDREKFIELGKTFGLEGAKLLAFVEKDREKEREEKRREEEREEKCKEEEREEKRREEERGRNADRKNERRNTGEKKKRKRD